MADESEAPSLALRVVSYIVVDLIGTICAVSVFGFLPGLIGWIAATHFIGPRKTRRRTYQAMAVSFVLVVLAGGVFYQRVQKINSVRKWEGVESPAFGFTTIDGKRIESAELRGKRVALNFWATWCGPCQMEIPEINRLFVAAGDGDVAVFGVSNESEETIRKFVAENAIDYPLVSMSAAQLPSPYRDIMAVPTTFVLDRKGIIQFVRPGYIGAEELQATIWAAEDHQGPTKSAPPAEAAS